VLLGGLSDYFGRKRMFIAEMIIFCAFLALLILCQNFLSLAICLFGLGLALGCDYPTAHMIISENIPSANRGKLVLAAFGFQAVGALAGTGIGFLVLKWSPTLSAWRWMFATALIPALAVTIARFFIVESANWLVVRGELEAAEKSLDRLLVRHPRYPNNVALAHHHWRKRGRARQSVVHGVVQRPQPARHDLRLGAMVPPGSRHLWHRHLYANHPCRGARRPIRPRPQPERSDIRHDPGR
jgi:MFS family permease